MVQGENDYHKFLEENYLYFQALNFVKVECHPTASEILLTDI
jgi:hypothetical protein